MHRIGVYPGTFDPITKGHLNIIERSTRIVDELIISIAIDVPKVSLFSLQERIEMVKNEISVLQTQTTTKLTVESFGGLLIDFAKKKNAAVIVRGLRAVSD